MDPETANALLIKLEEQDHSSNDLELEFANSITNSEEVDLKPFLDSSPTQLEIGSRNSAFLPYKPLTILTNLQRGNVKTLCRDVPPSQPLTFQENAAKGILTENDITSENVNAFDTDGYTALMWASFHGKLAIAEMLINKGADVNATGPEGSTSLMYAAAKGHADLVNHLLSCGAEMEAEDDFGNTALIHAAVSNQTATVNALLLHGASLTKPNFIGDNAFEIAFRKGNRASQQAMELHLKRTLEANAID